MRILVTGGFGFLGGRLAQAFATRGHEVAIGSRHAHAVPSWLRQASVVRCRWDDDEDLLAACRNVDAVAHLAGTNAGSSAADPVVALVFNGGATARLVRAAIRAGVRRFLYVSTAHVYRSPLTGTIDETTELSGSHPYATSHRVGEDAVRGAHERGDVAGVVVRLSNAFGVPTHVGVDCWSLLVNDLVRQGVETGEMVLRSSGVQRRDFIPLQEACRALVHLVELPTERLGDGVYNVGGGWSPTVLEMSERIASRFTLTLGTTPPIRRPSVTDEQSAPLDFRRDKLIATGFAPGASNAIDRELDDLIRFCVAHRSPVETS